MLNRNRSHGPEPRRGICGRARFVVCTTGLSVPSSSFLKKVLRRWGSPCARVAFMYASEEVVVSPRNARRSTACFCEQPP